MSAFSAPTVRAWTREWAQEEYKYTQVYAWELVVSWVWQWGDWSSHSRQTLCWIQLKHVSKNLSSKYILYKYEIIHAWCVRFELLSDTDRHITRGIHKIYPKGETRFAFTIVKDQHNKRYTQNIAKRRNPVCLYNSQRPTFTHLLGKSMIIEPTSNTLHTLGV